MPSVGPRAGKFRTVPEQKDAESQESSAEDEELPYESSEAGSVLSQAEASAEDCEGAARDSSDSSSDSGADERKRAIGSFTLNSNGYFAFSQHPNYPHCKVRILHRWACSTGEGGMGTKEKSKDATIHHYDDAGTGTTRTLLVLRAWMISRFQKHGFADARDERKLWLARQTCKLAADIRAMSVEGGGTGSARADKLIQSWAPGVWRTASAELDL